MTEKMQGFADTALKAMPKWAWGALGTFIGVVLTLQFTGFEAQLLHELMESSSAYHRAQSSR